MKETEIFDEQLCKDEELSGGGTAQIVFMQSQLTRRAGSAVADVLGLYTGQQKIPFDICINFESF